MTDYERGFLAGILSLKGQITAGTPSRPYARIVFTSIHEAAVREFARIAGVNVIFIEGQGDYSPQWQAIVNGKAATALLDSISSDF